MSIARGNAKMIVILPFDYPFLYRDNPRENIKAKTTHGVPSPTHGGAFHPPCPPPGAARPPYPPIIGNPHLFGRGRLFGLDYKAAV